MKGYVRSIEKAAQQNTTFRTVLYTAKNCQLVVMSAKPGEDIGAEVHKLDQFFRVEEGEGKAVLDGIEHRIKSGFAVLVPAGTRHTDPDGRFLGPHWDTIEKLHAFAETRGHTLLELAMSWLARKPLVVSIIAGATKPEQVEANAKSVEWALTPAEMAEVNKITA